MQGNTNLIPRTKPQRNNREDDTARQVRKLAERERQELRAQQRADKRGE